MVSFLNKTDQVQMDQQWDGNKAGIKQVFQLNFTLKI
jgi:hypothetical protein